MDRTFGKVSMKSLWIFALALLLLIAGCSKKEEAPASSASPATTSNDQSTSANGQAASQATAATPATSEKTGTATTAKKMASNSGSSAAAPKTLVIPEGTAITVRTTSALGSETSQAGETFAATVAEPIEVGGNVVIPKGADVTGKVVDAQKKGRFKGAARLQLTLTSVSVHGQQYPVETTMTTRSESGKGKRTAVTTGGGAGLGAIIGGIAGGGKGALIGGLVGGGAGLAGGALTGNKQIVVPAESMLTFKLNHAVTLK
jgi:3D (Asp-Asp-Asp) domain-containing protein